jgi:hypothetical protein
MIDVHRDADPQPENRSSKWFKVSNVNSVSFKLLPRKITPAFDIAFVCDPPYMVNQRSVFLVTTDPDIERRTWERTWEYEKSRIRTDLECNLEPGHLYRIHFAVLSSNADAVAFVLTACVADKGGQGRSTLRERLSVKLQAVQPSESDA